MLVPIELETELREFLSKRMGFDMIEHAKPQADGEMLRTVWDDRLVLVRRQGEQLEVWCGCPDKHKQLEDAWATHWLTLMTQAEGIVDDVDEPSNE